jgi:hypothetical protein
MSSKNWLLFALAALCGLAFGLLYGWVLSPVQYVDTTPADLRADFKADYTLMVAETYASEQNLDLAARRLASLGSQPPAEIATTALAFARQNGYAPEDLELLQTLTLALQTWQAPGSSGSQP